MAENFKFYCSLRSQAALEMMAYLSQMKDKLRENKLLNRFGRSLHEDGVRRPLRVVPFDPIRHAEEAVYTEQRYSFRTDQKQQPVLLSEREKDIQHALLFADPGNGKTEWLKFHAWQAAEAGFKSVKNQEEDLSNIIFPTFLHLDDVASMLGKDENNREKQREILRKFLVNVGCIAETVESLNDAQCMAAAMLKILVDNWFLSERLTSFVWRKWLPEKTQEVSQVSAQPLICLDAWDEVHGGQEILAQCFNAFGRISPCRIFLTSRIAGYNHNLLSEKSVQLKICPFEWEETCAFVMAWFGGALGKPVLETLSNQEPIRGLVSNPLMATLICLAFSPNAKWHAIDFPFRRAEVYEAVLLGFLGEWRLRRGISIQIQMTPAEKKRCERKMDMLGYVGWFFFEKGKDHFSIKELEAKIRDYLETETGKLLLGDEVQRLSSDVKADLLLLGETDRIQQGIENVVDALCHELIEADGVLAKIGEDKAETIYSFLHLTFLEYFTAREIVRTRQLRELAVHFEDAVWQEVMLLCSGIGDASELVQEILSQYNKKLQKIEHWQVLRSIISEAYSLDQKIQNRLLKRMNVKNPHEAARAAICLRTLSGRTLSTLDIDTLIRQFRAITDEESVAKGHLALLLGEKETDEEKKKAIAVLEPYLEKPDSHVRNLSALALDILGFDDREALDRVLMVQIPEGEFWTGEQFSLESEPVRLVKTGRYLIDRFPLTVGQYRNFWNSKIFNNRDYWSEEGWAWKEDYFGTAGYKYHWIDTVFFDANLYIASVPMFGISFYEAEACGVWLEKRLPTEEEWERAARGDWDKRKYPWGKRFSKNRCNVNSIIGHPTPVGNYSKGASPHGCYDISGNVREWTSSFYQDLPFIKGKPYSIAYRGINYPHRGGSWFDPQVSACCSFKFGSYPGEKWSLTGVRLARTL